MRNATRLAESRRQESCVWRIFEAVLRLVSNLVASLRSQSSSKVGPTARDDSRLVQYMRLTAHRLHDACHLPSRAGSAGGLGGLTGPTSSSRRAHPISLILSFTFFNFLHQRKKKKEAYNYLYEMWPLLIWSGAKKMHGEQEQENRRSITICYGFDRRNQFRLPELPKPRMPLHRWVAWKQSRALAAGRRYCEPLNVRLSGS